jgi:hypothetical protein
LSINGLIHDFKNISFSKLCFRADNEYEYTFDYGTQVAMGMVASDSADPGMAKATTRMHVQQAKKHRQLQRQQHQKQQQQESGDMDQYSRKDQTNWGRRSLRQQSKSILLASLCHFYTS